MGDVRVGQAVLTPQGGVTRVEAIYPQGVKEIFRVTFGDGATAECTGDHLWEIQERRTDSLWKSRSRVITTDELSRMATVIQIGRGANRRPTIPPTKPTAYCGQIVPVHPYLMGVLLGDATMRHESVYLSCADDELLNRVKELLPKSITPKHGGGCDYRLSGREGNYNVLIQALKTLGLWGKYSYEKFIPDVYKYNSVETRLELVRGLLDTDGWVDHNGQPRLEQTSKQLAADFAETVQSLGGLCTLKTKMGGYRTSDGERKETRTVYRQAILHEDAAFLFSLTRKKLKTKKRRWPVRRYIQKVEFVRNDEAQCIQISDPSGLYLTDNLIATHNTVGVGIRAVRRFLAGRRVLYAAPTQEQIDRFWVTVTRALAKPIEQGQVYKNETRHILEIPGTERRIRAKTAWNADTLRGDYADDLILDEWQLMNEEAWDVVGAPMLLDNDGDAIFIYTPPSLRSRSVSKANDPQHAAKLFRKAQADETGRWAAFHFSSHDNPFISASAIADLAQDMTAIAYRMEIGAEDIDEVPGALWTRALIESTRVIKAPEFDRVVVSIDPSATSTGDEAGIITAGKSSGQGYVIADDSIQGSPKTWASAAVTAYHRHKADCIVAESNNGGEMVSLTIATVDPNIRVKLVHASRGKQTRAEPIASIYEHGRGHHVGRFDRLEDEMVNWVPGDASPNRMDAAVWAFTELGLSAGEFKLFSL